MIPLQTVALAFLLLQITCYFCRFVGLSSSSCRPQILLHSQKFRSRIRQLRGRFLHVQLQQKLPLLHRLPFGHVNLLHKRIQLCPHHVRRNRLHFPVAADRRHQIFSRRRHRRNLRRRLPPAQPHQENRRDSRQQQENHNPISQPSIHVFLVQVASGPRPGAHKPRPSGFPQSISVTCCPTS